MTQRKIYIPKRHIISGNLQQLLLRRFPANDPRIYAAVNLPNRNIPISDWVARSDGTLHGDDPLGLGGGGGGGGSGLSQGPVRPSGTGVMLLWDRPILNTDLSTSRDFKTHKIYFGTSSGVYTQSLDLSTTANPGMNCWWLNGLSAGTTYYFAVSCINSRGIESALSSEIAAVAATYVDPASRSEPSWDGLITTPGSTISSPGSYKISTTLNSTSGNAINITANNVTLYGGNRYYGDGDNDVQINYATSADGHAINFGAAVTNFTGYGFDIRRGAASAATASSSAAFYRAGSLGSGCKIFDSNFVLNQARTIGIYTSGDPSDLLVYLCDVELRNGSSDLAFLRSMSASNNPKCFDCTILQDGTTGYCGPFHFIDGWDIGRFKHTLNSNVDQGFTAQGWGNGRGEYHDAYIISNSNQTRPFNPDGGCDNWQLHWNRIVFGDQASGGGDSRGISMRYGSELHSVGYNTIDASNAVDARCVRFGGNDGSWGGADPNNIWFYGNTLTGDVCLEFYGSEGGNGWFSKGNTYNGTGGTGILGSTGTPGITNVHFNDDVVSGAITNGMAGSEDWQVFNAFLAGAVTGSTAGMTFAGAATFSFAGTPQAPTNLRAISV